MCRERCSVPPRSLLCADARTRGYSLRQLSQRRGHHVITNSSTPQKLYLLQLSSTTVPIGPNRTLEMCLGCYLIQTSDAKNILIDTGIAPDAPLPPDTPKG